MRLQLTPTRWRDTRTSRPLLLRRISLLLHRPVECADSCEYLSIIPNWTRLIVISIREFTTLSFPVYMYDGEGKYKIMTMGEVSTFEVSGCSNLH